MTKKDILINVLTVATLLGVAALTLYAAVGGTLP